MQVAEVESHHMLVHASGPECFCSWVAEIHHQCKMQSQDQLGQVTRSRMQQSNEGSTRAQD